MIGVWGALLIFAGAYPPVDSVLKPDLGTGPEDGPAVIVHERPAQPLVAVRLSVPVREPAGLAGAVWVLQELARGAFEAGAATLGARAVLARTPSHAIYTVVGPADVFPEMVELLRRAVGAPDLSGAELASARHAADRVMAAELDTPEPLIRHRLRQALLAGLPAGGTAARLTAGDVTWIWRRYFIPERMTAVVVGPVVAETALGPFRGWRRPPEPRGSRPALAAESSPPAPQVVRPWVGLGYRTRAEPAVLAVTAEIVSRHLALLALRSCSAELWWSEDRRGLVVIASAAAATGAENAGPEVGGARLAERLRVAVAEAAAGVTPAAVAIARRRLFHEMLLAARTSQGLAQLIGDFQDRTGDADAAQDFLDDLVRVDARDVHRVLVSLDDDPPVIVEVHP